MKTTTLKRLLSALSLLVVSLLVFQPVAFAQGLSEEDINSIYSDTVWYQTANSSCSTAVDPGLAGGDNRQISFFYFVRKGLTPNQSAGIVGNMIWESGIQPQKIQGGGSSKNPSDAGSLGWGIVQWTPANTKVPGIVRDARITGPVYVLVTQLDMVWAQLTGKAGGYSEKQAGDDIKKTRTLEEAVRAFQGDSNIGGKYTGFERPANERGTLDDRTRLAKQVLNAFGGSTDGAIVPFEGLGECSASSGPGEDTRYINGFPIYSQCDVQWRNKPYGSGSTLTGACNGTAGPNTVGANGCGPAAMAMIITALTGRQITPDVTAAYADNHNLYVPGVGSSWEIGRVLAEHWGLNAALIGTSKAKITAALENGGLVIAAGKGSEPFTSSGHYIVIRAATADGHWMVGDSAHNNTNDKKWSPDQILQAININNASGSVYAITK